MVPGVTSDLQMRRISLIHKRLAAIQKSAPLSQSKRCRFLLTLAADDSLQKFLQF